MSSKLYRKMDKMVTKEVVAVNNVIVNNQPVIVNNINIKKGTMVFDKSMTGTLTFDIPFDKIPVISITLRTEFSTPPWLTYPSKTGFTINFKTKYTGDVDWMAITQD